MNKIAKFNSLKFSLHTVRLGENYQIVHSMQCLYFATSDVFLIGTLVTKLFDDVGQIKVHLRSYVY